jgi:hypothetical protein
VYKFDRIGMSKRSQFAVYLNMVTYFSNLVLFTTMVIRTKAKETLLVALHFKYVNILLPVTLPISVVLVRHNVWILCLDCGELASGCQLIYWLRTELYFSQQT